MRPASPACSPRLSICFQCTHRNARRGLTVGWPWPRCVPRFPYMLPTLDSARAVRPLHPYGPCSVRVTRTRPKHPRNQLGIPSRSTRTSTSTRQRLPIPCHAGIVAARCIARQPPAGRHSSSILSPLHCAVHPLRLVPPTRPLNLLLLVFYASPRLASPSGRLPSAPAPAPAPSRPCAIPPA